MLTYRRRHTDAQRRDRGQLAVVDFIIIWHWGTTTTRSAVGRRGCSFATVCDILTSFALSVFRLATGVYMLDARLRVREQSTLNQDCDRDGGVGGGCGVRRRFHCGGEGEGRAVAISIGYNVWLHVGLGHNNQTIDIHSVRDQYRRRTLGNTRIKENMYTNTNTNLEGKNNKIK